MVDYAELLPLGCSAFLIVAMVVVLPPGIIAFTVIITTLIAVLTSAATGTNQPKFASTQLLDTEIIPSHDGGEAVEWLDRLQNKDVSDGPRKDVEKERLMSTLKRDKKNWSASHPRHRLLDALFGFQNYRERQQVELTRLRGLYKLTTKGQKTFLDHHVQYSGKFDRVDAKLVQNQALCDKVVQAALNYYDICPKELAKHGKDILASGKKPEKVSVSQALKHYVRDWTESGESERNQTFPAILNTLDQLFPERKGAEEPLRILLPGSGLNRLAFDVAQLGGLEVTANEFSMYMNVAYRFLEANSSKNSSSFYPFTDVWSHHISEDDMLRQLQFPDVNAQSESVVLVEGDFTTVFNQEGGKYDILLTYFFIDTARNLMTYFDTIKHLIKPGGYWMNLGPLLYGTGPLVQLSLDEIITVTEAMGFTFLDTDESIGEITIPGKTVRGMRAVYSFDDRALTSSAYKAQFWLAQKN